MTAAQTVKRGARARRYADRREAGRLLAERLVGLADQRPVVIALPRGGVPVAFEVAAALSAPLDVLAVRKLGAPGNPEFGIGAVAEDGTGVIDQRAITTLEVGREKLNAIIAREAAELRRRVHLYRGARPAVRVADRTVIVVDDGVATGVTDTAALRALRKQRPRRLVLAVPVCPPSTLRELAVEADEVVCLQSPQSMLSVGHWYRDFSQVSDDVVVSLLDRAHDATANHEVVTIHAGSVPLAGDLRVPSSARGLVLFAHGSGSSRVSPRNVEVARMLNAHGLGTLLFDLLSERESQSRAKVFDVGLLSDRLLAATRWAQSRPDLAHLPLGYFGASTGAAAALSAAAALPHEVGAVVCRGGRPDLAGDSLAWVRAPTLLIVGSLDREVLALNQRAKERLQAPSELAVVPGAGHLFEEPGALASVAQLAGKWFGTHLVVPGSEAVGLP